MPPRTASSLESARRSASVAAGRLPVSRKRRAAQLQCLAIQDLGFFGRQKLVRLGAELLAELGIGIEALGGQGVDLEPARAAGLGFADRFGKRLVELFERGLGIALIEEMDGAVIAQASGDDRIEADLLGRARKQRVGFGIAAEVRFLQRFVGEALAPAERRIARIAHRREEFGGLGIAAGIVAAIGFGERPGGIERSGLDPGEGGGIADTGGGDRNLALDRLVGDDAAKPQQQGAIVTGESFGGVKQLALAQLVNPIADVGILELAVDHFDLAEVRHLG